MKKKCSYSKFQTSEYKCSLHRILNGTTRQTSDCQMSHYIHYNRRMWTLKYKVGPNFYQYDQCKVNDSLLFIW